MKTIIKYFSLISIFVLAGCSTQPPNKVGEHTSYYLSQLDPTLNSSDIVDKDTIFIDNEADLYKLLKTGTKAKKVKLKNKTYNLDRPLVFNEFNNIALNGNGATLILDSLVSDVIVINKSHNLTISHIRALHTEPTGPVGCTGNVILINGGSNITIKKSDLNGSGIVGISAYSTKNLKIMDNYIHDNSSYSIIYLGSSVTIMGNMFEDNGHDNKIAFSNDSTWPSKKMIDKNTNIKGLVMSGNAFR